MTVELHTSHPHGMIPNNRYPLIVMRGAIPGGGVGAVISTFRSNGWTNNWSNPGVYTYAHFHSTTHECLGCAKGSMTFRLSVGASGWSDVRVEAGDVVIIPAGVSHEDIGHSDDNVMCGGYPDDRNWDNVRPENLTDTGYREVGKRIMMLPVPKRDPVHGKPLADWINAPSSLDVWGRWRERLDTNE